ncbi:MAG: hypothetical protein CFE23_01160 [Flavobacterium sp. BFFFF1]|uniref:hypothetical protein n=1 Tax=Flavobacterium sp. BFFFF1 TaxID=2015557 RepID=UPI000BD84A57|nr:hypothetical protein [Flavobacterium sp. BFFFF1]OYU81943.1 MAG: hypothetical protein CFE23_01160 [Flavobacterium sp. BFFFF1]
MGRSLGILLVCCFLSCKNFKPEAKPEAIARVEESYLYKDDIRDLIPPGTSKPDSVIIVKNFIDRWASQKLLIKAAEVNLGKDKKAEFNELIKQYKSDLYTKAYLEEIVKRSIDTLVSDNELKDYYKENKDNFRTNGILVRLRFINLPKDHPKFETIRSKFLDFRKSDRKFWDTYQVQFKNSALNDSVWVDMGQIYRKLPFINPDNRDTYISGGVSFQRPEGNNVYLVKVRDVIDKNQIAPYAYLKPTLIEVILNKRKLELIKKFEKEITDDAIKNDKYEIYK